MQKRTKQVLNTETMYYTNCNLMFKTVAKELYCLLILLYMSKSPIFNLFCLMAHRHQLLKFCGAHIPQKTLPFLPICKEKKVHFFDSFTWKDYYYIASGHILLWKSQGKEVRALIKWSGIACLKSSCGKPAENHCSI